MKEKPEIWADVKDYEGLYRVSSHGRVYSYRTKIYYTKPPNRKIGYATVTLIKDGKRTTRNIHRLVAKALIPNPENKKTVNHINGDRFDNRVENLEWATHKENIVHSVKTGLHVDGVRSPFNKLKEEEVLEIEYLHKNDFPTAIIAEGYNVSPVLVLKISRRLIWKKLLARQILKEIEK
jgi:hypothetical protein